MEICIIVGDKDLAIPVLDPFHIESILLNDKNTKGLSLSIELRNLKVRGLKNLIIHESSS